MQFYVLFWKGIFSKKYSLKITKDKKLVKFYLHSFWQISLQFDEFFFFFFRLARQYTNCEDVVVTEDAFHGNLGVLIDISPKMHQYVPNYKPKDFVHVSPLPSSYRLSELLSDLETPSHLSGEKLDQWIAAKCAEKVEAIFVEAKKQGRGIAAFICEPCFVSSLCGRPLKEESKFFTTFFSLFRLSAVYICLIPATLKESTKYAEKMEHFLSLMKLKQG